MDSHLSSDTDGPSFVILDHKSLSQLDEAVMPQMDSTCSSSVSVSIQTRLDQLILENRELREALTQNNMAMKSQFDTLASWQEEVFKTHQSHKEKFAETRNLVLKLREENAFLKRDLETLSRSVENSGSSSKETFTSLVDSLKSQLVAETQRAKQMEAEKYILIKERDAFREECTRLTLKITHLESQVVQKCEELSSLRFEQQSSLKNTGARHSHSVPVTDSMKSWMYLNEMSIEPGTLTGNSVGMVQTQPVVDPEEVRRNEEREKDLLDLKEKYDILSKDHAQLTVGLRQSESRKEYLEEELATKDKLLNETIKELSNEREKVREFMAKSEELALLKAQAEVYKTDYDEERDARQKLAGEKENLQLEIRRLRSLLLSGSPSPRPTSDVPLVTSQEIRDVARADSSSLTTTAADADSSTAEDDQALHQTYECPICNLTFGDLENCRRHVDACLNSHENMSTV